VASSAGVSRHSPPHPSAVMSGDDGRSRKRYGGFCGNQKFAVMNLNDGLWSRAVTAQVGPLVAALPRYLKIPSIQEATRSGHKRHRCAASPMTPWLLRSLQDFVTLFSLRVMCDPARMASNIKMPLAGAAALLFAGVLGAQSAPVLAEPPDSSTANLDAVLWIQKSPEYALVSASQWRALAGQLPRLKRSGEALVASEIPANQAR